MALVLSSMSAWAQVDSRNRTVETVVADGLAQLPTQNLDDYDQVMGEIAGTGEKGVVILGSMLVPAGKGQNAKVEYALNGAVDFAMAPGNEALTAGVRSGLVKAFEACTDNANKAFLMTLLTKVATEKEYTVYEKALSDAYLQDYAVRGLCVMPNVDQQVMGLINGEKAPKKALAYLAQQRKLGDAESTLLSWTKGADASTLDAIYKALSVCGGTASAKALGNAAKNVKFKDDATHVTDSYLALVERLDAKKDMLAAGKEMVKSDVPAMRCAGLRLVLQNSDNKASKEVVKALGDADIQYRNTALQCATEIGGDGIVNAIQMAYNSFSPAAKVDVLRWAGSRHLTSMPAIVGRSMKSTEPGVAKAAIEAAGRIGDENSLVALISELGGENGEDAYNALLSFHSDSDVRGALQSAVYSENPVTAARAASLCSERHIYGAYKQIFALSNKSEGDYKSAYLNALSGVVQAKNFTDVAQMLERAQGADVAPLQAAAGAAIAGESAEKQFEMVKARMNGSATDALYYPLLAQTGSKEAVDVLVKAYNDSKSDAAYKALLAVNNVEVKDVMLSLARENSAKKDAFLNRYMDLVSKSSDSNALKYLQYREAVELNPSDDVKVALVKALGDTQEAPAAAYVATLMDNQATAKAAAEVVKTVVSKREELQGGAWTKAALNKAKGILQKASATDADAGYAVDEITGMLEKLGAEGAEVSDALAAKKVENFELSLDFKAGEAFTLVVRDMPIVKACDKGVKYVYGEKDGALNPNGEWNNLYVKVANDRIQLVVNGVEVEENAVMKNVPEEKALNYTGTLKIDGKPATRNVMFKQLPSTPVTTLTAEEKAAGFEMLFDGRSLEKWQGNTTCYVPVDGNIYVTAQYGGSGNLYTRKKYSDFVYRFEFCFGVPGVNNGIGVRTSIGVDAAYEGMEIQVLDHDDPIYKGLHPWQQHGGVYGIIVPKHVVFGEVGTWNTEEIRAVGDHITVTVNGEVILDGNIREACQGHNVAPDGSNKNPYTADGKNHPGLFNKEGFISFCGHGAGALFRNVRILDLSKPAAAKSKKKK